MQVRRPECVMWDRRWSRESRLQGREFMPRWLHHPRCSCSRSGCRFSITGDWQLHHRIGVICPTRGICCAWMDGYTKSMRELDLLIYRRKEF